MLLCLSSNLSLAHLRQGDYQKALTEANKGVELRGDWSKVHFRQGEVLREVGDYDGALASYRRALELDPRDSHLYSLVQGMAVRVVAVCCKNELF